MIEDASARCSILKIVIIEQPLDFAGGAEELETYVAAALVHNGNVVPPMTETR